MNEENKVLEVLVYDTLEGESDPVVTMKAIFFSLPQLREELEHHHQSRGANASREEDSCTFRASPLVKRGQCFEEEDSCTYSQQLEYLALGEKRGVWKRFETKVSHVYVRGMQETGLQPWEILR